jgi:S-DNA-T family DNA segregation ATPase FtsK/SpoIIIE
MKKKKGKAKKKQKEMPRRELVAVIVFVMTIIAFLGEFGLTMVVGDILVFCFKYFFGIARYPVYVYLLYVVYRIGAQLPLYEHMRQVVGFVLASIGFAVLLCLPGYLQADTTGKVLSVFHVHHATSNANLLLDGGGIVGVLPFGILHELTGFAGTLIISSIMLIVGGACVLQKSVSEVLSPVGDVVKTGAGKIQAARENHKQNKIYDVEQYLDEEQYGNEQVEQTKDDAPLSDTIALNTMFYDTADIDVLKDFELNTAHNTSFVEPGDEASAPTTVANAKPYKIPGLNFLHRPVAPTDEAGQVDPSVKAKILGQTLDNFKIKASVSSVQVGPAVTQYEVSLAPGVKVNRIVNLATDIALALAVKDVRIEAPIPGKSAVGIEVPNASVRMVGLYEVLRKGYNDKTKKLLVGLGRTINGDEVQIEINKMPHLLVAGSTGSGKSVCVNAIILSILLRATPDEVKFLMIDPKKVELNVYNDIPHLLAPVVTNPKAAAGALRKVVSMMDERYEIFADAFVRNLEGYNAYARKNNKQELPYIVVIIDELSDLMVVAAKEVEESIMRLAQMARAAGIHLIVATQRPSVDVITGVIKSNIPSRIAFAVSSQVDSRTILDGSGAEKLVGRGDMLYLSAGENKPLRVQGAYISEEEIEKIVGFVKEQQASNYDTQLLAVAKQTSDDESDGLFGQSADDELFSEAVEFAITIKMISTSKLQRRFHIGFNRAARIIDSMVEAGMLGPVEGNKGRRVLISDVSELAGRPVSSDEGQLLEH